MSLLFYPCLWCDQWMAVLSVSLSVWIITLKLCDIHGPQIIAPIDLSKPPGKASILTLTL